MTTDFKDIETELGELREPQQIQQWLLRLLDRTDLPRSVRLRVLRLGMGQLFDLTGMNPQIVEDVLTQLVPPALRKAADDDNDAGIERYRIRELLPDVISQLSIDDRTRVRSVLYSMLGGMIISEDESDARFAFSFLRTLGFRDSLIFASLVEHAQDESWRGSESTQTLIALRVPHDDRVRLQSLVQARITSAAMKEFGGTIRQMIRQRWLDDDIVNQILESLRNCPADDLKQWSDASMVLGPLADIAQGYPFNLTWHGKVWDLLSDLQSRFPKQILPALELTGAYTESVNDRRVISDMLELHADRFSPEQVAQGAFWRVYLRLADCVMPEHSAGWKAAGQREGRWMAHVEHDACANTNAKGNWVTSNMRVKEEAWDAVLQLGLRQIPDWAGRATDDETSPYVAESIYKRLACWPNLPLTARTQDLIASPFELENRSDDGELIRRLGAIQFASSLVSWDAFETLLNVGLTSHGHCLVNVCDDIGQMALALARDDLGRVASRLWAQTSAEGPTYLRDLAVSVLKEIALQHQLPDDDIEKFLTLASDNSVSDFSCATALDAIRGLRKSLDDKLAQRIAALLSASVPDDVQAAAADILAANGRLQMLDRQRLHDDFGLVWSDESWTLREGFRPSERVVFTLGLLYAKHGPSATNVAVRQLKTVDGPGLYVLLGLVGSHGVNTPPEVVDAVVERIKFRTTAYYAETPLFNLLLAISPEKLLQTDWEKCWSNWHAEALEGLLNAIRDIVPSPTTDESRVTQLAVALAFDGRYAVRRAAYRALSNRVPAILQDLVVSWSREDKNIESRKRAAEAAVWFPDEVHVPRELEELLVDCEPEVAEVAAKACRERTERQLAHRYVEKILNELGTKNDVPDLWFYGQAIERLGDDWDQERLKRMIRTNQLLPHQRKWIKRLAGHIEKRWRGVTAKWPQPWLRLDGIVEECSGELIAGAKTFKASVTLWATYRQSPSQFGSWSALINFTDERSPLAAHFVFNEADNSIRIPGRQVAKVVMGSTIGSSLLVHGNGPYPN